LADPLLARLLSDSKPVVQRLLDEAPWSVERLRADLDAFDETLADDASTLADLDTAQALILGCHALLDAHPGATGRTLQLLHVAVRYVVIEEDGDGDLDSPFGFDDDVEVFNACAEELGATGLVIG
jgi:hypothetical protein